MIEPMLAKRIRLIGLDVDGTMTDGGIYLGTKLPGAERAFEMKRFDIQDGLGVALLKKAGLIVAIVTGRGGDGARERARELKVDEYAEQGNASKLSVFDSLLQKHGVRIEDAAYLGDDLIDLPILKRVGLPVAVANATAEVKARCGYCTQQQGGRGAVREFVEVFLKARGAWNDAVKGYLQEQGDDGRV